MTTPDDRDTDPEIPVPEEPPTRPDLRLVTCPKCKGEGHVLDLREWGTQHRAVAKPCPFCGGSKRVDHAALARHHAERQGRPPR